MKPTLDNWQRIEQVIKWTGFASVSAFAREIGLNRSENLYQIKRGNNRISRDLADNITAKFPQLSKAWLLTGEGAMLKDDMSEHYADIPFFRYDVVQFLLQEEKPKPENYVSFPLFKGSDFAALTVSNAMEPGIPCGAAVFFQKTELDLAIPGEAYLVLSRSFSGIRFLRREVGSKQVRLVPANKADYDEIVVGGDTIESLYLVRGVAIDRAK